MPAGSLEIVPFDPDSLSGAYFEVETPSRAYLYDYLSALNATAVIVEGHYIDRHYLDEYAEYYARSFHPPTSTWCQRLHFFEGISDHDLEEKLAQAYESVDQAERIERELEDKYLGFVVRRPLVGAAMGRTVLRTYPADSGRRHYEVVRPYRVHIAGLNLKVRGLAYQQQDRGAAVCASTALWSALQRVAYVNGHRTPTPRAVTRASQSPYPASTGLDDIHMAMALSNLGYIADTFAPLDNRKLFRAKVTACLASHLPVILLIAKKVATGADGEVLVGHAVTVTGYSEPPAVVDVPGPSPIRMRSGSLEVIYVHDDNLGSHAHYELFDSDELDDADHKKLMLRRGRSTVPNPPWWTVDEWSIEGALVPKPDKLRLPIEDLLGHLFALRWMFEIIFRGLQLDFSTRFESGVDYKRSLIGKGFDAAALQEFVSGLALPRHVGVISVMAGGTHLCDAITDVSEVERIPGWPSILALVGHGVPIRSTAWKLLQAVIGFLQKQKVVNAVGILSMPPNP